MLAPWANVLTMHGRFTPIRFDVAEERNAHALPIRIVLPSTRSNEARP
jgi:hypothetical protein